VLGADHPDTLTTEARINELRALAVTCDAGLPPMGDAQRSSKSPQLAGGYGRWIVY
jgi:hypothetical protein